MSATANSTVQSKEDVLHILHERREALRALGVERIGLFGSFVREEQTSDSDVDILVEFAVNQKTFDHFMDLCFLLEDIFGRRVDVLTVDYLSPFFGPHILKEAEFLDVAISA